MAVTFDDAPFNVHSIPEPQCIPQLLQSWASRTPDAAAILAPHRINLSYRELWAECERAGAMLNQLGVGDGDRVALVLPNGPEAAVAFLSVASVTACAPLNPALRVAEFDNALTDLGATTVVIGAGAKSAAADAASARGARIIELLTMPGAAAGMLALDGDMRAARRQLRPAQPQDVALVLQTSGTTSRAKCVPLTHKNICRSAASIRRSLELTDGDRCLNVMPLFHCHGLIGALLSSLAAGGSVVCAPDFYAPEFLNWLREFHSTWCTAVPSMYQSILARTAGLDRPVPSHLRFVRSCSAALPVRVMTELEEVFGVPVIEAYGMTEAAHQIASNRRPPACRKPGSVGLPTGVAIAILDTDGRHCGPGQTGEIAIRGESVTSGYEQNPAANLATFANGWLRTGDEGYQDQDGYLFIVGRLKEMINRGGEKIWPAEVDAVLLSHAAVAQAVTFAVPDDRLGEEVGAAVVLRSGAIATEREIVDFAAARLADFKLPRHLVLVNEIPKGPTGKFQRAGLAATLGLINRSESPGRGQFLAPRSTLEHQLTAIWQEVLKVAPIGVDDHFLDLGGDSVLATVILARIRDVTGLELRARDLFDSPTIARLADALSRMHRAPLSARGDVRSDPDKSAPPPLSFSQQRLWFVHQCRPATPSYNRPVLLELRGVLDVAALERAMNEIVRRHEVLRTTFPAPSGIPVQHVSSPLLVPIVRFDFRERAPNRRRPDAERHLTGLATQPFDLEVGPLVRAALASVDRDEHLLLLVFHHIVFDAKSAEIVFHELAAHYGAFSQQMPSPLEELPAQYVDFARWERDSLREPSRGKQLAYWKEQLRGCPARLDLPTDRPRPPSSNFLGGQQSMVVDDQLTARLRELSRRENVTLFVTLLSAFKVLLHRYTGAADIVVGCPITRRSIRSAEQLVGCFINTLVLRTNVSGDPSLGALLRRVRETALNAYDHADIPFHTLVVDLGPRREADQTPFFNVIFGFETADQDVAQSGGVTFRQLTAPTTTAMCDLILEVIDRNGSLSCELTYRSELFDGPTIERTLHHFRAVLEAMATNLNDKLSVVALPVASETSQAAEPAYDIEDRVPLHGERVEPVEREATSVLDTATERMLASIWADVLFQAVTARGNFFTPGGHSLLVQNLSSRIARTFGVELPVRELLEAATLTQMAQKIDVIKNKNEVEPAARSTARSNTALSFAQERLWFLDGLRPNSTMYNMPLAFRITGPLDHRALNGALNALIERHEALRTIIATDGGCPKPVILASGARPLPIDDLTELDDVAGSDALGKRIVAEARTPFDLAHDPPLRFQLIRLAPAEHVLLVTFHHIAADAWSLTVFRRELSQLYAGLLEGHEPRLPKLPIQYGDFARWQREWLQGERLDTELAYWKRQLADPPLLELPYERPLFAAADDFRGWRQTLEIPDTLTRALNQLARKEGATLFMTVLAAFKVLLARLTGSDDIIVGLPVAGRDREETEGLIGFFLNTLALRTRISRDLTFRQVLAAVREVALDGYAHAHLPFEKIVEELNIARDVARNPLFDILVNGDAMEPEPLALPGLQVETIPRIETKSKFAITLYVLQRSHQLWIELVSRRALYSRQRMAVLLEQFGSLLAQLVAAPDQPIARHSLVTRGARVVLPDPTIPISETVHPAVLQQFASCAASTPEAVALRKDGRCWTYAELATRIISLERILCRLGVAKGEVVAVTGRREVDLVAAAFAVWARGGVLMLIDPHLPAERRRLMMKEANARWIVRVGASSCDDDWMDQASGFRVIDIDKEIVEQEATALAPADVRALGAGLTPNDSAYIVFTSGSSGVPKAVLGTHKGLSHFLDWQRKAFQIGPSDRCAQVTALSFDPVMREIFLPLTSGATLALPSDADESSSAALLRFLDRERITLLHAVPSRTLEWLRRAPSDVTLRNLRWLFMAGEPLSDAVVQQWRRAFPEAGEIVNLYGPTETTLAKSFYIVPRDVIPGVQPVGRPLPSTQALVVSPEGQLCGFGEPGEIVLRTPFRTKGYINAAEEQQRRFKSNPFLHGGDDVVYYTGDRGRYRVDGLLEILGRLDDQVKIRGVRIEPAEVNAALSRHPSVGASVVVGRTNEDGETSLIAYVVPSQAPADPTELRAHVASCLPPAFIPEVFVNLEALPLLPNGKVDARSLPAPARHPVCETAVSPEGPLEEALAEIWRDVLDLPSVSRHDDFFELGGHSLLATQIISRVREVLKVDMPLRSLFESATIARFARAVVAVQDAAVSSPVRGLPPLVRQARPVSLPS